MIKGLKMKELRGYRYRIYPDGEQSVQIAKTVGCARLMYNLLLADYKSQLGGDEKPKLHEVTYFKEEKPFLSEVDSLALANAKQNLHAALTNWSKSKKGKRKGKKVKFPKFHAKSKSRLTYTTNNQNGTVRIEGDRIKLPKVGFVKVVLDREPAGEIRSCTVEQGRDGRFFVSLCMEVEVRQKNKNKRYDDIKVVGVDMSFPHFSVDSDETPDCTKTKYVRQYRSNERRLKRLQRNVSKKVKGSANREKAREKLARLHAHVANCRKDFCHKESRRYADNWDVIVLEDINMQSMARLRNNGKSANDLGFGMFRRMLEYKCRETDSMVLCADRWFASSKTCHCCGYRKDDLELKDREWVCPECGVVHDRDRNAAMNLKGYFYKVVTEESYNTAGTAGIYASGEAVSTLRETLRHAASLNEETPSFRWG